MSQFAVFMRVLSYRGFSLSTWFGRKVAHRMLILADPGCSGDTCQGENYSISLCNASLINGTTRQCSSPQVNNDILDTVYTGVGMSALLTLMIASGCHISLRTIWDHLKRPWAVLTGMACQYILLPVIAFCAALAFSLEPNTAVAFMICFTCPGGAYSNLASLAVDGDISLRLDMVLLIESLYSLDCFSSRSRLHGKEYKRSYVKFYHKTPKTTTAESSWGKKAREPCNSSICVH